MTVSTSDVKAVIGTSRSDLAPFIATAQLLVDEELQDSGLSAERKTQIVIYLAAHLTEISDKIVARERIGESEDTYKQPSDFDQGLSSTNYGQTAMLLDTTGTLAGLAASKGLKARFDFIADNSHSTNGKRSWSEC